MRRLTSLAGSVIMIGLLLAACGGAASRSTSTSRGHHTTKHAPAGSRHSVAPRPKPAPPAYPRLFGSAQRSQPTPFVAAAAWHGQTAAWVARTASGIALLSFDQRLLQLTLHSGTIDAGATGWRWGPVVAGAERRRLVGAFNGGFKFDVGAGGFQSDGRVAKPLQDGLGSIVIYRDGHTDIGTWHQGVPAAGAPVASVRQNLTLLVDHGQPAPNVDCVSCWGATLGGVSDPARSALGITADGRLIWAGGEHLTVAQLADALRAARVVRAVELDINPEWVAAYLYGHRRGTGPLAPVPIVQGQPGVPGQFLAPYSRDFFTLDTR